MDTVASNPGGIRIHWPTYIKYRKLWFGLGFGFFLVGVLTLLLYGFDEKGVGMFATATATCGWFLWNCRKRWIHGDTNGGVVISTEPFLVAVVADMSQYPDDASAPALKVIGGPEPPEGAEVGARYSTVALYVPNPKGNVWKDIDAELVYTATNDEEQLKRSLESIPQWQWRALADAVKQVEAPEKGGLYAVNIDFEAYMAGDKEGQEEGIRVPGLLEGEDDEQEEEPAAVELTDDGRIRFVCGTCSQGYKVEAKHAGKAVKCKKCGSRMVVPG